MAVNSVKGIQLTPLMYDGRIDVSKGPKKDGNWADVSSFTSKINCFSTFRPSIPTAIWDKVTQG